MCPPAALKNFPFLNNFSIETFRNYIVTTIYFKLYSLLLSHSVEKLTSLTGYYRKEKNKIIDFLHTGAKYQILN